MKKIFAMLLLISIFTFFPSNVEAMLRVDENGNPIEVEVKEGEYITMSEPTVDEGGNVSSDIAPDEKTNETQPSEKAGEIGREIEVSGDDTPVSSDDIAKNSVIDMNTTALEGDAELFRASVSTKKDNDLLYIILSSFAGLSIGSIGTYFFMSKKR